jgi:aminopeptidase-like protein
MAMLWVLNLSDGSNSLLDISERSGYPFHIIKNAADTLAECRLVKKMTGDE